MSTFEFRTADGRVCCSSDDRACLCEHCQAAARDQIVDPYAAGITALRTRYGIPERDDTETLARMASFRDRVCEQRLVASALLPRGRRDDELLPPDPYGPHLATLRASYR
jgi:hypothetical protein